MIHFTDIQSLPGLKKQYRALALANHPDRGGSTEIMQQINAEFNKLFKLWEYDKSTPETASGYESDYAEASARQYADYVYNEYRWTGSNYKGQSTREIVGILRNWLKETYPRFTFSVRSDYNSIRIDLIKADFAAFRSESNVKVHKQINHYHLDKDGDITERAKEVMKNVYDFVMSYNFDDSDAMTDYFHTNFYLSLGIGNSTHPYKIEIPKLKGKKGETIPQFKHPEGNAHKAIRRALGNARFGSSDSRKYGQMTVLGEDSHGENGQTYFWPKSYSSSKQAHGRMQKLNAAGIRCKLTGYNGGYIQFLGYTEETEAALERERSEVAEAMKLWREKHPA